MSDNFKNIFVISGSVTSGYGLAQNIPRWPELIEKSFPNFTVELFTEDNLSYQKAIEILASREITGEILIGYFGTRLGWPRIPIFMQWFLPEIFKRPTAFDLSVKFRADPRKPIKYIFRSFIKRFLKQLAVHLNLYKPEKKISELLEEIQLFFRIASEKFEKIYFIQHHHLEDGRLAFESQTYNSYYISILNFVRIQSEVEIEVIELPAEFFNPRNYLPDNLHLSMQGHVELSQILVQRLTR